MRRPLLVRGGDSAAFAALGRVDWAAALPEFLERLGLGGWEVAALEGLVGEVVVGRPAVLVAFAPESLWGEAAVEALVGFDGPLLVEGPLPASVAERLVGVRVIGEDEQFVGSIQAVAGLGLDVQDDLKRHLRRRAALHTPRPLSPLSERLAMTAAKTPDDALLTRPEWRAAIAYLGVAVAGCAAPERFYVYPRTILQGCTLLIYGALAARARPSQHWPDAGFGDWSYAASSRLLARLCGGLGSAEKPLAPVDLEALMRESRDDGAWHEPIEFEALASVASETIEFLAAGLELARVTQPADVPPYLELLHAARPLAAPLETLRLESVSWRVEDAPATDADEEAVALPAGRLAALRLWADLLETTVDVVPPPPHVVREPASAEEAWRLRSIATAAAGRSPDLQEAIVQGAGRVLTRLERQGSAGEVAVGTAIFTAHAAARVGAQKFAEQLVADAALHMGDVPSGLLRDTKVRMGFDVGLSLLCVLRGQLRSVSPPPQSVRELRSSLPWERGLGPLQHWRERDHSSEALVEASSRDRDGEKLPLLVRRDQRLALSFPLISWTVAECSPPPPPPGERYGRLAPSSEPAALALALVEWLVIAAHGGRLLVWPWPALIGATLRHDVDRVPPLDTIRSILEGEARHRQAATYCFLPDRQATPLRELLEDLGHEIAVHGADIRSLAEDLAELRRWAASSVVGWTAHGTPQATSATGPVSWLAAARAGVAYADFSGALSTSFPHPPVVLAEDGLRAETLDIDLFDVDRGLDSLLDKGAASARGLRELERLADQCLQHRDHCCLNNHPDLGGAAHAEMVSWFVSRVGAAAWWTTFAEAARRRRLIQRVTLRRLADDMELRSDVEVAALQLVAQPPARTHLCVIDADGEAVSRLACGLDPDLFALDLPAGATVRLGWRVESDDLPELLPSTPEPIHRRTEHGEIGRWLQERGIRLPGETPFASLRVLVGNEPRQARVSDDGEGSNGGAISANSAPRLGQGVRLLLQRAYGVSLSGRHILELGCGAGLLGLWMVTEGEARTLAVYEVAEERTRVLQQAVGQLGLAGVSVASLDLDQLDLPAGGFDIALVTDPHRQPQCLGANTLGAIRASLKPDGVLVLRAANRWSAIDPISGLPGLHFLRRAEARQARAQLSGLDRDYDNTRLMSPHDLVETLRPSGFGQLRVSIEDGDVVPGAALHAQAFFLSARRTD